MHILIIHAEKHEISVCLEIVRLYVRIREREREKERDRKIDSQKHFNNNKETIKIVLPPHFGISLCVQSSQYVSIRKYSKQKKKRTSFSF
jgi:hypothetical protein